MTPAYTGTTSSQWFWKNQKLVPRLGYSGEMYEAAWNTFVALLGRPQAPVNAQLIWIKTFKPVEAYDSVAFVKHSEFQFMYTFCVDEIFSGFPVRRRPE